MLKPKNEVCNLRMAQLRGFLFCVFFDVFLQRQLASKVIS